MKYAPRMYVITADGKWSGVPVTDELETLQGHVGGLIQYVPMPDTCPLEFIVNEEGLLLGLKHNHIASDLLKSFWVQAYDADALQMGMLEIVGDCVVKVKD